MNTIIDTLYESIFDVLISNPYFDFKDIDNPIGHELDSRFTFKLNPEMYNLMNIYVEKNEYTTSDDYLGLSTPKTGEFFRADEFTVDKFPKNSEYVVSSYIYMSSKINQYERQVMSFMDIIGLIGGFFELFQVIAGFFIEYFVSKIFAFSLVNNLEKTKMSYKKLTKVERSPDVIYQPNEISEQHQVLPSEEAKQLGLVNNSKLSNFRSRVHQLIQSGSNVMNTPRNQ